MAADKINKYGLKNKDLVVTCLASKKAVKQSDKSIGLEIKKLVKMIKNGDDYALFSKGDTSIFAMRVGGNTIEVWVGKNCDQIVFNA